MKVILSCVALAVSSLGCVPQAYGESVPDVDLIIVHQTLRDTLGDYKGRGSSNAEIRVGDPQCLTNQAFVACRLYDNWSQTHLTLSESIQSDKVFDLYAALFRVSGGNRRAIKEIYCLWNDMKKGVKNLKCDIKFKN